MTCTFMYHCYDTSMDKYITIEQRIKEIKKELMNLGEMRPGSISVQKRKWGGEYNQLSYSHKGKGHTQYIKEEDLESIKVQLENYRKLKELTKEWVNLALQCAQLKTKK